MIIQGLQLSLQREWCWSGAVSCASTLISWWPPIPAESLRHSEFQVLAADAFRANWEQKEDTCRGWLRRMTSSSQGQRPSWCMLTATRGFLPARSQNAGKGSTKNSNSSLLKQSTGVGHLVQYISRCPKEVDPV